MYMRSKKMQLYLRCLDRLDNLILEHGDCEAAMGDFKEYLKKYADGMYEPSRLYFCEILKDYTRSDVLSLMMKFHKLIEIDLDAYSIYEVSDKKSQRKAVIIAVIQPLPNAEKWVEFFKMEGHL